MVYRVVFRTARTTSWEILSQETNKQTNKQKTNAEALISECELDRYVYLNIAFKIYI